MLSDHKKIKSPIVKNNCFRNILDKCHFNSFVVLDLDNNVIECTQELGSDQWFVELIKRAKGFENTAIAVYHVVQHHSKMQLVEPDIGKIIKIFQDVNIPYIAVTARGTPIIAPTFKQLKSLELSFENTWADSYFTLPIGMGEDQVTYQDGIIFCNGQDKARCIDEFFKILNFYPSHLIMMDDKEKHLLSVQKLMEKLNIEFDGLWNTILDKKVSEFKLENANAQLERLKPFLSSKENVLIEKLNLFSPKPPLTRHATLYDLPKDEKMEFTCYN